MAQEKHYFIKIDCGTDLKYAKQKMRLLLADGWNPDGVDLFEATEIDAESEEE